MPDVKILHLSDLHIGDDLKWRSVIHGHLWGQKPDAKVVAGLTAAIRKLEPDFIVLSGDLVNKATADTYKFAAVTLKKILGDAFFPIGDRLLIVPGNHDVPVYGTASADDNRRLALYRKFLKDFLPGGSSTRIVRVDNEKKVLFACLDSTLKGGQLILAEGEVGKDQLKALGKEFNEHLSIAEFDDYLKVAVLHHNAEDIVRTDSAGNRFMHLLDAADVKAKLRALGFHAVLHGHRHVPRLDRLPSPTDRGIMTVIGAGTGLCPDPAEQVGHGNNFNWIIANSESISNQLYRADANGAFVAAATPERFSTTSVPDTGYQARHITQVSMLAPDGTLTETVSRSGIRVAKPGTVIAKLPVEIRAGAPNARVERPVPWADDPTLEVGWHRGGNFLEGAWVFREPLVDGSKEATLAYSYILRDGTAMSVAQYRQMYPDAADEEGTSVVVKDQATNLFMEILFPVVPRFSVRPFIRLRVNGAEVPDSRHKALGLKSTFDSKVNRFVVSWANPLTEHTVAICWKLPKTWSLPPQSVPPVALPPRAIDNPADPPYSKDA